MALDALHDALNGEGTFWKKVAGACWRAACDIENEDAGTANHANRLIWAAKAKANRKAVARETLSDVLKNATLAADHRSAAGGASPAGEPGRLYRVLWAVRPQSLPHLVLSREDLR